MRLFGVLLLSTLAAPAIAEQAPAIGKETVISFAGNGGLRDWQRGGAVSDTLYVRDRTEQWYKVTLSGPCRLDQPLATLIYTTDTNGTFDSFSTIRVSTYPQQLCGVKSIQTSLPPGSSGRSPEDLTLHGWLILDKPVGPGSTDAVSAVKRALRAGCYPKLKVGHGGTLDPLASGVLPVALGEATKLAGRLLDSDKVYEFTVRVGEQTDTLDAEGSVVATSPVRPTAADVAAVLPRFTGAIRQRPPAYSALKVGGERAYDLARAGEEVVLAERDVTVHSLKSSAGRGGGAAEGRDGGGSDLAGEPGSAPPPPPLRGGPPLRPGEDLQEITLVAHVSKGTYIRSLARDIALALGTVGHVIHLRRLKAGPFDLTQAITLDKLAEVGMARELEHHLLPLRAGLDDIPALPLTPDQAGALRQGRVLAGIAADDGLHFALLGDLPVALVEVRDHEVRVERGFNLSPMSQELS